MQRFFVCSHFLFLVLTLFYTAFLVGDSLPIFISAIAGILFCAWCTFLLGLKGRTGHLTFRPEMPDGAMLEDALAQAFQFVSQKNQPLALRIFTPENPLKIRFSLHNDARGSIWIHQNGRRKRVLPFANRWIAEHPFPVDLPTNRTITLFLRPTQSDRVHVSLHRGKKVSAPAFAALFLLLFLSLTLKDGASVTAWLTGCCCWLLFAKRGFDGPSQYFTRK